LEQLSLEVPENTRTLFTLSFETSVTDFYFVQAISADLFEPSYFIGFLFELGYECLNTIEGRLNLAVEAFR
jgi:hypothetical protein